MVLKPYDSSFTFDPTTPFETQEISDMSELSGTVLNLEPSTKYELQVYGINDANILGDKASILHFTAIATGTTLLQGHCFQTCICYMCLSLYTNIPQDEGIAACY